MFTNPLNRKFKAGGQISIEQYGKAFKNWLRSNKEGFKGKSDQEIANVITDMSKSEDGKKSVNSLKTEFENNNPEYKGVLEKSSEKKEQGGIIKSKFADGGKFQDFICKHGRGGDIGCGCNGGKVIRGEDGLPDIDPNSREARKARRTAKKADDLNGVTRRSTSYIETPEGKWGFEEGDVNGNTTETYFFAPNGSVPTQVDTPWVQKIYTPYGYRIVRGNQNSAGWTTLGPRVENILSQEDGGVLKGRDGMSTRSIFRIAQNQNEDNPSMRTIRRTYRDLKRQNLNAGMSRRDSKALARADILGPSQNFMDSLSDDIMADVDADINADTNIANSALNQYLQSSNNNWNELLNRNSVQAVKPMDTSKYYNALSFGDAFNTARKFGHNTFQWRGKTYGTNTDPNWRSKWGLDNGTQSDWASEKENAIIRMNESTSTDATTPEQEPAPVFINGRFVNASIPQDIWTNSAITSRSANTPTSTYTSTPRRNYSAITGQALKPGQSSWDLFEQGGVLKGQQGLVTNLNRSDKNNRAKRWTRREALDVAQAGNEDAPSRRTLRKEYRQLKREGLENGLGWRARRDDARRRLVGGYNMNGEFQSTTPELILPSFEGPKKYTEGVITTEAPVVTEVTATKRSPITVVPMPQQEGPSITDSLAAQKAFNDAWMQYQYERGIYNNRTGAYTAGQDGQAYMNWMYGDFKKNYDPTTGKMNSNWYWRQPTNEELKMYENTPYYGAVLPGSAQARREYGIDLDNYRFLTPETMLVQADPYELSAEQRRDVAKYPTTIGPGSNDIHGNVGKLMGSLIGITVGADIANQMIASAPEMWEAAKQGSQKAIQYFKDLATQQASAGYSIQPGTPRYSVSTPNSAGISRLTGFNAQTPATTTWAVDGLVQPRVFPIGFKQGGQIEKPIINRFKNVLHK